MFEKPKLPSSLLVAKLAVKDGNMLRVEAFVGPDFRVGRERWSPGSLYLEGQMQDRDKLWYWSTPVWTWEQLCGQAGFAIVREGEAIDHILTVMN